VSNGFRRAEPWTLRGPPKQHDLVAEHQELGLAFDFAETSANEESEGRTERQLDDSQQHRAILTTLRQVSPGRIGITQPLTLGGVVPDRPLGRRHREERMRGGQARVS
jgi:hypothetical protein